MEDNIIGVVKECIDLQQDEISALEAIYDTSWKCTDVNKFQIEIEPSLSFSEKCSVLLTVTFTETYPLQEPPSFEISAPWMNTLEKGLIHDLLIDCYLSNYQEPVVFKWISEIKEFIDGCVLSRNKNSNDKFSHKDTEKCFQERTTSLIPISLERLQFVEKFLVSSDLIVDRKSYFQGHCIQIFSKAEVDEVISYLKSIPKVARATHNVVAYRFLDSNNHLNADYDDDGEHNAGGRVSHLLDVTKVENVVVVVSRWFGGILLGPDRFKHINQAARNALVKANFIN